MLPAPRGGSAALFPRALNSAEAEAPSRLTSLFALITLKARLRLLMSNQAES